MTHDIQIREIKETDANSIVELSEQLGYTIETSIVSDQISNILSNKNHFCFVATNNKKVIGFIHGFLAIRLTSPPFMEIAGLIVSEDFRNIGIGSKLVRHIESLYTECASTRVRCNVKRSEAHKFYLNLGYSDKKVQNVFEKRK
ncbi:MAG: GNAT family N-acetyltransferase [Bacteroidales bacterium]